jgi:hypothetical protein
MGCGTSVVAGVTGRRRPVMMTDDAKFALGF